MVPVCKCLPSLLLDVCIYVHLRVVFVLRFLCAQSIITLCDVMSKGQLAVNFRQR